MFALYVTAQQIVDHNSQSVRVLLCCCSHPALASEQDVSRLQQRLVDWLLFWRSANWRHKRQPFLLLASAEVTLGVRTILTMVKDRFWHWQQARNLQEVRAAAAVQQQRIQWAIFPWHLLKQHRGHQPPGFEWRSQRLPPQPPAKQKQKEPTVTSVQQQRMQKSLSTLAGGPTTLYQLGLETNVQLMQEVLINPQVGAFCCTLTGSRAKCCCMMSCICWQQFVQKGKTDAICRPVSA